ncbi:lanthionine synthetase LanC family protein [Lascolabacillus massiliensis]|uniref:lanthionine synthetase LanC family protein n=1 Tax=Lascolabacillus massiliensis TaxID=1627894 RepID=UPI0006B341C6|nr:lanthionine synthetase LanC family protein [Lascolabacillus massiliensis]
MIDNCLIETANHLAINGCFWRNLGLCNGKIGIAIFLFHYSRYSTEDSYKYIAENLIDDVYNEMHDMLTIDLEDGYCGIGWGLQHLYNYKFICGDINQILLEIDEKIMERDVVRIKDKGILNGLGGILHYVLIRLSNNINNNIFDADYLLRLSLSSEKIIDLKSESEIITLAQSYLSYYKSNKLNYYDKDLINLLSDSRIYKNDEFKELNWLGRNNKIMKNTKLVIL